SLTYAGGAVGNGGDTVFCEDQARVSTFKGFYNLDYLINKISDVEMSKDFEKVVGPNDPSDVNFRRILKAFQSDKKYKVLYYDLKGFYEGIWANVLGQRYVWKKAPYGVVDVEDEGLRHRIPPNCLDAKNQLIQTVLRTPKNWQMEIPGRQGSYYVFGADYTYSTQIISKLLPLQLSFLLFHEWLRNFTHDPELIRDANAVFHSEGWSGDDIEKKLDILKVMRLDNLTTLRIAN
ncbi:MAG: hypothetical protein SGJ18_05530, partial [Pseudomonadota bacterium]|nr:hypothetical protein [Pseudomonadota bacterium]